MFPKADVKSIRKDVNYEEQFRRIIKHDQSI